MFCSKHSDCEAPISVLTDILSENDPIKFKKISEEFEVLGFKKVKDLAQTTFGKASSIKLCGDSLTLLYKALEMYDEHLDNLLKSAKLENKNGNFNKTQQICEEILQHKPDDLNVIILMAESFFKSRNYEKSISFLKLAKTLNPNSFEVLNNIASNYWKQSQYDLAKYYLSEAIFKKPFYNNGWINYAEALFKTNDIKSAEYVYIQILNLKPDSYTVRNKYGKFLLSINKNKNAKQQFKIAQKSAPEFQETLCNLGDVYFKTDKFDKAILNYHKALEVNSNLKNTLVNLGLAYLKVTEYSKAITSFEKAIELDPDNISALRYLAVTYCYQDNMLLSVETYKKCLKLQPDNLDINLELALVYFHNLENFQEAEKYFEKCIELNSQREDLYKYLFAVNQKLNKYKNASDICISLGDLYLDRFDLENARNAFTTAVYFNPENAHGHWKVGLTMHNLGQFDLALMRYRKAIELKPNFAHAYCDSAIIYEKYDLYEKALKYYKMALQLQPDHLNALINMSLLKQKLGQFDDIVDIYKRILQIDESDAFDVHMNLANILHKEIGNLNDALFHYEKALAYDNTFVEIYVRMGIICTELNMSKKALSYLYTAIQLDSQCLEAFIKVGSIHKDSDNFIDAIRAYETVLKLKPDFPEVYCNLVQCLQKVCDWSDYDSHMAKLKEIVNQELEDDQVLSLLPHDSLLLPLSFEVQKKIATKYAQHCVEKLKKSIEEPQQFIYPTSIKFTAGNLRIGFVSTNFNKYPITTIMEFLSRLNDDQIFVICYSISANDNIPSWLNLLSNFKYKDLSHLKVNDAAKIINNDAIHVLVDMCGYSKGSKPEIFALRPAPVQVSWFGYPNTSGASFMDYLITDRVCSPSELQNLYTEKLAYINQTIFIGDHKQKFSNLRQLKVVDTTNDISHKNIYLNGNSFNEMESAETICIDEEPSTSVISYSKSRFNLPENVVVFCNFSKLYKIDPFTFRTWLTILNNVPNSVLWLLHLNDAAENNLKKFADDLNFDSSRIIFADFIPKYQHLNRIQLADIYLDTRLYNGHMACLDALWAGVPVVTLPGETYASRVTASQLTSLGITNTIAQNEGNYIEIAIQLGLNKQVLENIKRNIWELKMQSDVFDINTYAKEIILILKSMWNNYLSIHELDM
ncbi:UDP-N-acetylglucosamine--peptide N-acetylglucosaminyltransferase 110 kDa subunit-like isoform X2 [Melanaphis sacchari]|nr:UDP-N-acetylglucosamine--peptide N-acetylglucosaminyltransferase 110 kDa subunit-like isoform X2 [Melanaphis sacchari]XP_025206800.1 UDP-N-acetylglucosamine--peptide N-acetylglucosaminyltransferase 110 kDa subunit-like isoform X2 [Melanaphis sacchari]XP_025206828.1 UDP-N-acetylglucosamine--peptide N-acetylglucosaminyltransferase 110 kDa subunit-like isoform X2 [Melanaphis sacchari]